MRHRDARLNHIIENWTFPTVTERLNLVGALAEDKGKIGFQQSDNSYWRLTNNSPLTWVPMVTVSGGGGAGEAGDTTPSPYSIQLDGFSQYVSLASLPLVPNGDFTLEQWVKMAASNVNNVIFGGGSSTSNYWGLIARNDGNGLCFQHLVTPGPTTFIGASAATISPADGWVHIALTRSGNTWTFYKNGVSYKSATSSQLGFAGGSEAIGRFTTGAAFWNGSIFDVRVWSLARSAAEILGNMTSQIAAGTAGLMGNWKQLTSPSFTMRDYSGNKNHGLIVNNPVLSTNKPF